MRLGVILRSGEPEDAWNAFRLANFALKQGDGVNVFLIGKGVEYEEKSTLDFPSKAEAEKFVAAGGRIFACGTCLRLRKKEGDALCPMSSMKELYTIIKESDKIVCL